MWNKSLPLYKQVANKIKEDITSANLSNEGMIPSESKLVERYEVSRVTVRHAIKLLEEEDILYSVQGSGTYIKDKKIEYDILKVQSFTAEMTERNTNFTNIILDFQLTDPSPIIQKKLDLPNGEKIFYVKRLRQINEEPYIVEESYLPAKFFPELSVNIMEKSLYEHIKQKGYEIDEKQSEIIPTMPTEEVKHLLQLDKDIPILLMENQCMFPENLKFEYTKVYFHPQKYKFKYSMR